MSRLTCENCCYFWQPVVYDRAGHPVLDEDGDAVYATPRPVCNFNDPLIPAPCEDDYYEDETEEPDWDDLYDFAVGYAYTH